MSGNIDIIVEPKEEAKILATLYSKDKSNSAKRLLLAKLTSDLFSSKERKFYFNFAKRKLSKKQSITLTSIKSNHYFLAKYKPYLKVLRRTPVLSRNEYADAIEILEQCKKNRTIQSVSDYIIDLGEEEVLDYSKIFTDIEGIIKKGSETGLEFSVAGHMDKSEVLKSSSAITIINELQKREIEDAPVIPTGIPQFDEINGGLILGTLNVITGPTGGGKSILGLNVARSCYMTSGDALIVNLEMMEDEQWARLLSIETGIDNQRISGGNLTDKERLSIKVAKEKFWKIGIDAKRKFTILSPGRSNDGTMRNQQLSVTPISDICRQLNGAYKVRIWDWLGLFPHEPMRFEREDLRLGHTANILKLDSMINNVANVLLCQYDDEGQRVKYSRAVDHPSDLIIGFDVEKIVNEEDNTVTKLCHFTTIKHRKQKPAMWSAYLDGERSGYTPKEISMDEDNNKPKSKRGGHNKQKGKYRNKKSEKGRRQSPTKMEGFKKERSWSIDEDDY